MIAEKIDIKKMALEQELEQLALEKRLVKIELKEVFLRSELRLLNQNGTQSEETKTPLTAMTNDNPMPKRDAGSDPKGEAVVKELKPLVLSTKQHAAAQMLIGHCQDKQIAERFGVSINTAKQHVQLIKKKLNASLVDDEKVLNRGHMEALLKEKFRQIDKAKYLLESGGLPKDWHENYVSPKDCRYKHLYEKRR